MSFYRNKDCHAYWVAAGILAVAGARAQSTNVPSRDTSLDQIPEVVVTANRREENNQTVPSSVTAISGDTATGQGITDPQSLAAAIPGLTWNRETATSLPFLRGVGTPVGQVGDEPSVAYYVDDVYVPSGAASLANFNNVERLEVEKGPQGTLFGRNATGGVVQVFTKDPTSEPMLDVSATHANYNTSSGSIYATGGLTPTLSVNLSLYGGDQRDGWGKDLTTGHDAFTGNYFGGRIKALWEPSDDTRVLLAFDHDTTVTSEGFFRPDAGTVGAGFFPAPSGFYNIVDDTDPYTRITQSGASVKVTEDFHWAQLVSVTAYRSTDQLQRFEESGAPIPLFNIDINIAPENTWTEELRLLSQTSSSFIWMAGFFYMKDKAGYDPITFSGAALEPLPFASSYALQYTNSYSGFVDATEAILPDTKLTAGLRYTVDQRKLNADFDLGGLGVIAANAPQSKTYSKPSGRLSLSHQFTDDVLTYISYNRGFKSGVFNTIVLPGGNIAPPVQPETLDDYSIGEKSEFFNHRIRLNAEAFYYKYKNIQIEQILGGVSELTNAAGATIKGIDIDLAAKPLERLTLTAGMELLDGKYTSYPNGLFWQYEPGCAPASSNCSLAPGPNLAGNKTIETPPFSFSIGADYLFPTSVGNFDFNVAYNHGGDYYNDPDNGKGQPNSSYDKQPILNIVNASLLWKSLDEKWDIRFWGKNITGQKYTSYQTEDQFATQYSPAPPATYGVTAGAHFK